VGVALSDHQRLHNLLLSSSTEEFVYDAQFLHKEFVYDRPQFFQKEFVLDVQFLHPPAIPFTLPTLKEQNLAIEAMALALGSS
jgi:hypothetical protein